MEISNGEGVGRLVEKCMASGEAGVIDEDLPRPACGFRCDAEDMGLCTGLTKGELFVRPRTAPADRDVTFARSEVVLRFGGGG